MILTALIRQPFAMESKDKAIPLNKFSRSSVIFRIITKQDFADKKAINAKMIKKKEKAKRSSIMIRGHSKKSVLKAKAPRARVLCIGKVTQNEWEVTGWGGGDGVEGDEDADVDDPYLYR